MACLVGAFCGPRDLMPITLSNSGGNTAVAGLNRRESAAVSSRTSPSLSVSGARLVLQLYLSAYSLAEADSASTYKKFGYATSANLFSSVKSIRFFVRKLDRRCMQAAPAQRTV